MTITIRCARFVYVEFKFGLRQKIFPQKLNRLPASNVMLELGETLRNMWINGRHREPRSSKTSAPSVLPANHANHMLKSRLVCVGSKSNRPSPSSHVLGATTSTNSPRRPHEVFTTFGRKDTKHLDRQSALLKAKPLLRTAGSDYVALPRSPAAPPPPLPPGPLHSLTSTPPMPPPRNDSVAVRSRDLDTSVVASRRRSPHEAMAVPRAVAVTAMVGVAGSNTVTTISSGDTRNGTATVAAARSVAGNDDDCGSLTTCCGTFNKPARGWIHSDQEIAELGAAYEVRYVGRLDVNTSMKILDFETRSLVAKECINRICEAAGLKTADRKRKVDKKVTRMLGDRPSMEHAGADVHLIVTSTCLQLRHMESNEVVAVHDMPNISFASGGDADTLDFVAYVAKDVAGNRACYVLECGGKWAQDVITTIGQAFELRFKEFLRNSSSSRRYVLDSTFSRTTDEALQRIDNGRPVPSAPSGDDPVYYNDLPGKVPPELAAEMAGATTVALPSERSNTKNDVSSDLSPSSHCHASSAKDLSPNLIDLNSELSGPEPFPRKLCPEYANDSVCAANTATLPLGGVTLLDTYSPRELSMQSDPFDMQPFEASLLPTPTTNTNHLLRPKALLLACIQNLHKEDWYHGPISRRDAEVLIELDGEFLVRESLGSPGQYVLTGMQGGTKKHLLLVDPEGVVRTKDKTFDSVSHLVNYHRNNELPIILAESALILRHPVPKRS